MTRDEAIRVFDQNTNIHDRSDTPRWIDRLVALGILKLDEPTFSPVEKLYYAMNNSYHCGLATFRATLEENGLRIVER